ncbi:SOM1 protein [Calycina marina]|uniref:SOM1 protein n=1 Tax=Calycina marina TaxID=1763456 RepID=A0A9P7Z4F4_9HELO|nr:SOM1 protein [Calycina marina]
MNNVNMAGMNALGGPVGGGGMPMMNNGAPGGGPRPQMPINESQRSQLNTYIYDYFLRNQMYDCARALYQSDPTMKVIKSSPGQNGDNRGDEESKDDVDKQRPDDLPRSDVPRECPESCFLYEWWCLFWDMFNAQRGKADNPKVTQYVQHTQANSRRMQENQQQMMRGAMPNQHQLMMMQRQQAANGMALNQNELRKNAANNNIRNFTPQQQMQKQQQMQRDPSSGGDHQQRTGSPGSADNAPSPSKRPRLDSAGFNPQQQLANGRGQPMQQFQPMPNGANTQRQSLGQYQQNLSVHQANQMPVKGMQNPGGPPNAASPGMMNQQDPSAISQYYNAGEMSSGAAGNNMRQGPANTAPAGGGNHALQDYQVQLMLLEQQNKKRLMMARQEQDSMGGGMPGGQGRDVGPSMGPNGQSFQGTSPQGPRSVNSPNPSEMNKRTPHLNQPGIPSPLPEGQTRDSPGNMNFIPGQMDPNMYPQPFVKNGMDPGMMPQNGAMRPPSSHPGFSSNNGMTANQMAIANQQRNGNWQGPNGQQMMPGQGGPQQGIPQPQGTPQQRPMAPPVGPVTNGGQRLPPSPQQSANAPPTPSQGNKANPKNKKNDAKNTKDKRGAMKKGSAPTTGATPQDSTQEPATPTPATPVTSHHTKGFNPLNGAAAPATNGQAPQQMNTGMNLQNDFNMGDNAFNFNMEFTDNPNSGDVLQDFDFDSFLHQDGDNDQFNFDASAFLDADNQIVAE